MSEYGQGWRRNRPDSAEAEAAKLRYEVAEMIANFFGRPVDPDPDLDLAQRIINRLENR